MKIYYASQSFYPHIGGVSTYLFNLCKKMVDKGNEVVEVHLRPSGEVHEAELKGIEIFRVPRDPINTDIMKKYSQFKETIYKACHYKMDIDVKPEELEGYKEYNIVNEYFGDELKNLIKQDPADVVHIHDFQLLYAYKYIPRGTPLVLTWHIPFIKTMSKPLKYFLIKHMSEFDKVVFSSPEYIDAVIDAGLPREKVELIHPIANTELFSKKDINQDEIRKKYNLPIESKIILSVQRIDPKSGHEQLIRSMPDVLKKIPNAKLVFVGGDSLSNKLSDTRAKIKEKILNLIDELGLKDDVIFTGTIDYHKLPDVYNSVDLVALCSKNEGFGLSLTEAMACGNALVGTNVGGIPLQIEDSYNGLIVEVGDVLATSDSIIKILTDDNLRNEMRKNSLKVVDDNFNINIGIKKHLILYNSVMKEKNEFKKLDFLSKNDISAIATDLDRTLVDIPPKDIFDPNDFDSIIFDKLKSLNKELILITGRSFSFVKSFSENFPIWSCVICENGSILYFPDTKRKVVINTEQMIKAKKIVSEMDLIGTYVGDVLISIKIKYQDEVKEKLGSLCSNLNFVKNVDELMILPFEVNKGFALKIAQLFLNIDQDKTIIVGDAENDIDMFLNPGIKIALKNSIPELKQLSIQVMDEPSSKGILKMIDLLNK